MANVNALTKKKAKLEESLVNVETTTEAKVAELTAHCETAIKQMADRFQEKIDGVKNGVAGKKERLQEEIAEVNAELQKEIGALQAQIDAIRGTATTVVEVESDEVL